MKRLVQCALINTIGLKQISHWLRSNTVRTDYSHLLMFFVIISLLHPTPSPFHKFPLRRADPSCQRFVLSDAWWEGLSQTKNCHLLVCTTRTMLFLCIESVPSRWYTCADERLVRILRHGTIARTMHLLDVPSVLLLAAGKVRCRADSSNTRVGL